MTYQLSTVRTRIQQKLDNTSFDTATLNQFINDGQRDIFNSRRFTFMEREVDLTSIADSDQVTGYPTTVQVPLSLRTYNPKNYARLMTYIEYEDFDQTIPNPNLVGHTVPQSWYIFNGTISVYPIADSINTYTFRLKYLKKPTELVNDSDVPEVPEEFGELLVLAGFKRAQEFDDDYDQAQLTQRQIDKLITTMDERYKRQSGLPHVMRSPWRTRRSVGGNRGSI